ncbi:N-acetyltransferase [Pseudomonas protegens]|uniref:GNAT family N-acetyltransferase n=1 Tax=Pseudomonas protegens TaxID=380021 RepID=UPI00218238B7|nr:GNAT family N-acetyltransferase [Pseudomonas protegens]
MPYTFFQQISHAPDCTGNARIALSCTGLSDLLAPGVWHVGLFMVASSLRGRGIARQLHRELEDWAAGMGARWLRLSVVFANVRAEGFWRACGYVEARTRDGIELGQLRHRVRIMIKPLSLDSLEDYLTLMPRDRVEPPVSV